jgi:glycosyltransferase involved in cell wall biosynthesis
MNILINASNLHAGGGVQVAASFIKELTDINLKPDSLHILVSSTVDQNLNSMNFDKSNFKTYEVYDSRGLVKSIFNLHKKLRGFDVVFSVFGAIYVLPKLKFHIVGFADPWVVYPKNEIYLDYSIKNKFFVSFKILIKKYFFSGYSHLIVELPHVKAALKNKNLQPNQEISVIGNTISSIYFKPKEWRPIDFDLKLNSDLVLGYLGRAYEHKNLKILIDVDEILKEQYNLTCNFIFTLTKNEMELNQFIDKDNFISVGSINIDQCPSFYEHIDALIFPSLLECFSVTPLEAMIMKKQVIASNRAFIKDVCLDHAYYFDPMDSKSIANEINKYYLNKSKDLLKIEKAYEHAMSFSSARHRAEKYLEVIKNTIT